jgi:hypothetical protein
MGIIFNQVVDEGNILRSGNPASVFDSQIHGQST